MLVRMASLPLFYCAILLLSILRPSVVAATQCLPHPSALSPARGHGGYGRRGRVCHCERCCRRQDDGLRGAEKRSFLRQFILETEQTGSGQT